MRKTKKLLAMLAVLGLLVSIVSMTGTIVYAAEPVGAVAISVDADTLGVGYLYEPVLVPLYADETVLDLLRRGVGTANLQGGIASWGSYYLEGFKLPRTISVSLATMPAALAQEIVNRNPGGVLAAGASAAGEFLTEFDYTNKSGWTFGLNHAPASEGMDTAKPKNGDVIRFEFTLFGSSDLGNDWGAEWGGYGYNMAEPKDKTALTMEAAKINSSASKAAILGAAAVKTAYDKAYVVLQNLTASEDEIAGALASLKNALAEQLAKAKTDAKAALDAYKAGVNYLDEQQAALDEAIAAGKKAIDDAADYAGVQAALTTAKTAMDGVETYNPWWASLPSFLQWILRYLCFGWIWMVPARAEWFCHYILFGWLFG